MTLKLGSIENLNEIYIIYICIYFNFNWELFFCKTWLRRGGLNTPLTAVQLFFFKSEHCVKPVCKQNSDKGELT